MLISIVAVAVSLLGFAQPASAHFIIRDSTTGVKALFHVTPDHDPIAGEESIISFDFSKTGFQAKAYSYSLTVKPVKGEAVAVPLEVVGNVVMASYVFPAQGFYDIQLSATSKDDNVVSQLDYGQRVSRGVVVEKSNEFGLLEIGAIAGVVLIAVGAIFFSLLNDRNDRKEKRDEKRNRR